MQAIDIDSIIKKYSKPLTDQASSRTASTEPYQLAFPPAQPLQANLQFNYQSPFRFSSSNDIKSSFAKSQLHNAYNFTNNYDNNPTFDCNHAHFTSNSAQNFYKPTQSIIQAPSPTYPTNKPTDFQTPSSNYFSTISALQSQFGTKETSRKAINQDNPPQIIVPETNLINVFGSSKQHQHTADFNLYDPGKYSLGLQQQKPQSYRNQLLSFEQSRLKQQTPYHLNYHSFAKPIPYSFTPSYSPHDYTTFNPFLQRSTIGQLSKPDEDLSNKTFSTYRQLNPAISLKPNKEGFIPLHMTKEQMDYEVSDINSVQLQDKKVYDRLQVTCKIKSANQKEFNDGFCGWTKNVKYDISTKDDNKKKGFWGKWC